MVKSKDGGESGKAWKGEERAARSYVFVRKGEEPKPGAPKAKSGRKVESDSEEEDEEREGIWSDDAEEEMLKEEDVDNNDQEVDSDTD